ncbi:MAG: bifunctional phosphoribosyl-AMP cyclohydrolase/phosphoribosyl-ATP diphosphatase HisIE [Cyclobacteriaceae bacterium]|jgi:phosphoribosyl-ATP pyrophosphohydrolase/phosphoribosyl-AMP cyclohydrolase|nr:bifunctional phosphoribosyl-AMP cyclohydrolase/phosphoribosyl-ATP diphosphatase HisIE [Cyclobacteriaceae bacterium]
MNIETLRFDKLQGLIPCIVQDSETKAVLMLGFMNQEALEKTIAEKRVTFFSRSKNRLWTKGETSGNFLEVENIIADCDQDTLLIEAKPKGVVCHTGTSTCFGNSSPDKFSLASLDALIQDRKVHPIEKSYTNTLLAGSINKVAQKVGEEAVELVIESKDNDKDLFLGEAADLMYHFLILLAAKNYRLSDVEEVLEKRFRKKTTE